MAVLNSVSDNELIVSCACGCDDGIHIKIEKSFGDFAYMTYTNGNYYTEQGGVFTTFETKMRKIWSIIRNKDFYYSDVVMSEKDFQMFKEWINQF